jgi:WD40 repeat protein
MIGYIGIATSRKTKNGLWCGMTLKSTKALWAIILVYGADRCAATAQAADPTASFDFPKVEAAVASDGIRSVVERLGESRQQLATALIHVAPYLEHDKQQLWFQLQARTRLEGWEDFQAELREQTPDETLIALSSNLNAVAAGGEGAWQFGNAPISYLGLSSDRKHVYCGSAAGAFVVLDAKSLEIVRRDDDAGFVLTAFPGPKGDVYAAHKRDRRLRDTGISVNEAMTGKEVAKLRGMRPEHTYLGNLAMPPGLIGSPDGRRVIQEEDSIAFSNRSFDDLSDLVRFRGGGDRTFCRTVFMRFVEDGRQLLTADNNGHVRHFSYPDCKESRVGQHISGMMVTGYDLSPDESLLTCSRAGVRKNGKERFGEVVVWDRLAGRELFRYKLKDDPPVSVAFLGDGETVVAGGLSGNLYVWHGDEAPISTSTPHGATVGRLVAAPDGKRIFSGDTAGHLKLTTPTPTTKQARPLPTQPTVLQRAISPDGAWEAQFSGRTIEILQKRSGKVLAIELSDEDAESLGDIASIALNSTRGIATIGGQEAILHLRLQTKQTKLVKLDASKIPRDPLILRAIERKRGTLPRLRVVITPDSKHAVMWSRKAVASFNPVSGANEFVQPVEVRHFGGRYSFLSRERIAINYQGFGDGGRIEGLRIFDLAKREEADNLVHGAFQVGIAINPKTDAIVTSGRLKHGHGKDNMPKLLFRNANAREFTEVELPEMYGDVVGITEDGERLLTLALRPGVLFVWDIATRKPIRRFDLGVDLLRGRLDGSTLVCKGRGRMSEEDYWFRYHRSK